MRRPEVNPVSPLLTTVTVKRYWTTIPHGLVSSQLVLREGAIYSCSAKVLGEYFGKDPKRFRILHVSITGTVPLELTERFKRQLTKAVIRKTEEELGTSVPKFNVDLLEVL